MPATDPRASLLCLVFTDLVDSTALKSRLGDVATGELMAAYHQDILRLAKEDGGREIDSAGDGFFLTFEAPSAAVRFSLRLQRLHAERTELPDVRIGLHLGEVTERAAPEGSSKPMLVEGLAVDQAARVGALATGRQVLMSKPVFDAARQRLDEGDLGMPVSWLAHGPYLLKGIDQSVEVGEAGFEGFSPLAPPPDSEKGRSAIAAGDELTLGWRPAVGLRIPGRPHWQLAEQIGTGAIGEVWLAIHETTDARRVFKFCFQAESLRSLKREVALLGLLKESLGGRPDIAQVIDWEFDAPPYFLETAHSESGDLVGWARAQGGIDKVPLAVRLDLICQIADALAAAHGAGVLHKDLKPANVLIREDADGRPRVCLTDFGIGLVTNRQMLEVPGATALGLTDALLSSSVATGAGTRLYMAPEVTEGRESTELADVYSLGVILYQIVAGDFRRALAPGWERHIEDPLLRDDIADCVDGEPTKRLAGPAELAARLRALPQRAAATRSAGTRRRLLRVGIATTLTLILGFGAFQAYRFWAKVRWAQNVAQPELVKRIEANDYAAAFALATEIEEALGTNPALEPVWRIVSGHVAFETDPPAAIVSYRRYEDPDGEWLPLGKTPIPRTRVPRGPAVWRIEKPGYRTRYFVRLPPNVENEVTVWPSNFVLDPEEAGVEDTVAVQGRRYVQVSLGGFPQGAAYELERFLIDRTEVRNDAYQEFVDAGGYRRPELWTQPFVDGDRTLDFSQAMARFRDSTGRAGPATWVAGRHPDGLGTQPVGGVSWYEALAYAAFRGRSLPTAYHWSAAALPDSEIIDPLAPMLASQSNLNAKGPMPVGATTGMSAAGAADMFGNVAEWVWTTGGADQRFLLGSGWSDPEYQAPQVALASPWSRLPTQGFRLATYPAGEPAAALLASVEIAKVDHRNLKPLSDDALEILRQLTTYEPAPLNATREPFELPDGSIIERVEVDVPYSEERLPIFLLRPESVSPPYQTLIWFGGLNAVLTEDNSSLYAADMSFSSFLRQSGRMLVMPIWSDTFERNDGSTRRRFLQDHAAQSEIIRTWSKDLQRTLDFLQTSDEVDSSRIGFIGLSLGAAVGGAIVGYEDRLKTAVFWSGGFAASAFPENAVNSVTLARRTTLPVLMLNGRHDFVFPYEPHQRAFFELLGTPDEHKRHVVWDAGHFGWPLGAFVRENLDWLDRYLGPVASQ